jgi:hypothetical protein
MTYHNNGHYDMATISTYHNNMSKKTEKDDISKAYPIKTDCVI